MNNSIIEVCSKIISSSYVSIASDNRKTLENNFRILLEQKKWPIEGWKENVIKMFLSELSLMDSNNWPMVCGVGEREGRVICPMIATRHLGFSHGIGRSGDVTEEQPKAIGSSLLMKLTNSLATDALQTLGLSSISSAIVVPMATGMSLMMCLLGLKQTRGANSRYVLWSRCDQKSAIKAVHTAGLEIQVVELMLRDKELITDVEKFEVLINKLGSEQIVCILTTTSCFAPRSPDKLEEIAMLAKKHNIPHLVNNAYGLQSTKCIHLIQQAARVGRVDLVVQSTDKNFLVPVGGSIIASFDKSTLQLIAKMYPGRASITASLDLFTTLMYLGSQGYKELLRQRKEAFEHLKNGLNLCAVKWSQQLIYSKANSISLGLTLDGLDADKATMIGSMLNKRGISGARVVAKGVVKELCGVRLEGFGGHCASYPHHYLTAAASLGTSISQIDLFLKKLDVVLKLTYSGKKMTDGDVIERVIDVEVDEDLCEEDGT